MSYSNNPYGSPYYPSQYPQRQPPQEPIDERAYWALGLGIGSVVLFCCIVPGAVMGVFAVLNGLNAYQSDNSTSKVLGIVGIVLGGLGVLMTAGFVILGTVLTVMDAVNK